jgi:hypothetical protein
MYFITILVASVDETVCKGFGLGPETIGANVKVEKVVRSMWV